MNLVDLYVSKQWPASDNLCSWAKQVNKIKKERLPFNALLQSFVVVGCWKVIYQQGPSPGQKHLCSFRKIVIIDNCKKCTRKDLSKSNAKLRSSLSNISWSNQDFSCLFNGIKLFHLTVQDFSERQCIGCVVANCFNPTPRWWQLR